MQIVTPTNTFQDVYVLSGFPAGTSLIVTNNSSHTIYLNQSTLAPTCEGGERYGTGPGGTLTMTERMSVTLKRASENVWDVVGQTEAEA